MLINHGTLLLDGTVEDLKSDRRRVVVDFQGVPELKGEHGARVAERSGERICFEVTGRVADFVADITASYAVHDLTVEHPPIEETVAALYRREQEPALRADGDRGGTLDV